MTVGLQGPKVIGFMAHEFVGCFVLLTLISPPAERVQGTVTKIEGQRLFLKDVHLLSSDLKTPYVVIEGEDIADVEVLAALSPPTVSWSGSPESIIKIEELSSPTRSLLATTSSSHASNHDILQTTMNKVDQDTQSITRQEPSRQYSRGEAEVHSTTKSLRTPSTSISSKPSPPDTAILSIQNAHVTEPYKSHQTPRSQAASLVSATLSGPFHSLSLSEIPAAHQAKIAELSPPGIQGPMQDGLNDKPECKKRRHRRRKKPAPGDNSMFLPLPPAPSQRGSIVKAKSNTNSALVLKSAPAGMDGDVSNDSNDDFQPPQSSTVKGRKRRQLTRHQRQTSEWEAEDTTKIHKLPEFDFAANLSKFDKHAIFSRFKNDDTTADEARLVGHNRLPRPGTNGGKNLHYSENVLDTSQLPPIPGKWTSEAGESDSDSVLEAQTRDLVLRRPSSRPPTSRPSSSSKREFDPPRSAASLRSVPWSEPSRPQSSARARIVATNRPLHLTPLQSVEAEAFAVSDLGLTEDMMTENAARGIAEVVVRDLKERATAIKQPVVIIFAGNHKTGARAISAGRHLLNRGVQVVTVILDANARQHEDGHDAFLPAVRQALHAFCKAGGKSWTLLTYLHAFDLPAFSSHVLLDAVFGIHIQPSNPPAAAYDFIEDLLEVSQVPRGDEHLISIDAPFGRDATTGMAMDLHGRHSLRWPDHVVFLGTAKVWREVLLEAAGEEEERERMLQESKAWVVDLGFDFARTGGGPIGNRAGWGEAWVEELGVE